LELLLLVPKAKDSRKWGTWKRDPVSVPLVAGVGDEICHHRCTPRRCLIDLVVFAGYYARDPPLSSIHRRRRCHGASGCEALRRSVSSCVRLGEANEVFLA